jgi:hypothetical protein
MVTRKPPAERQGWTAEELAELNRRARARRRVLGLPETTGAALDAEGGPELVEIVGPEATGVPAPVDDPVVEVPEQRRPS